MAPDTEASSMNNLLITHSHQINASWLTETLTAAGALTSGEVSGFDILQTSSNHGDNVRIMPVYGPDASGARPSSLFLKICKPASAIFGRTEVDLYTVIAPAVQESPFPRCYDHAYDSGTGRYHLLLEDLSDTHLSSWDLVPTEAWACQVAAALGHMHSAWWDRLELRADGQAYPDTAAIERLVAHYQPGVKPLLAAVEVQLSAEDQALLRRIYRGLPQALAARAAQARHLTFIHGDINLGNILTPKDTRARVYLVDRQIFAWQLAIWSGTSDLAYFMGLWFEPATRRSLEQAVLRTYYAQLCEGGVIDYSWDHLWDDYRLGIMQALYIPTDWCIEDETRRTMAWLWQAQQRRILAAVIDLKSDDLLSPPSD